MDFPIYPTDHESALTYAEAMTRATSKAHTAVFLPAAANWAAITDDDVTAYGLDGVRMQSIRRFTTDVLNMADYGMPELDPTSLEETGELIYCFTFDAPGEPWHGATFGMVTVSGMVDPAGLAVKAQAVRNSFKPTTTACPEN